MYVAPAMTTMTTSISASIRSSSPAFAAANPRSTTNFKPCPTASTAAGGDDEADRREDHLRRYGRRKRPTRASVRAR